MGSPELVQYADFYADMTRRFGLTDNLELLRGFADSMLDGTGIAVTDPRINLAQADPAGCRRR